MAQSHVTDQQETYEVEIYERYHGPFEDGEPHGGTGRTPHTVTDHRYEGSFLVLTLEDGTEAPYAESAFTSARIYQSE